MKIKILGRDMQSLEKHLNGRKRIMTYGAGALADDIKKLLAAYGYKLDCAVADSQYLDKNASEKKGGGKNPVNIVSWDRLDPPYMPQSDALIWAIGSPGKLRDSMEDDRMPEECFLIWDMGFWKDRHYADIHKREFCKAGELLCDEYSKKVFWSYIEAVKGNAADDISYGTDGTYFNELTEEKRNGAFVDCGSYDGQSAMDYMKFTGRECRVYAFEPDKCNFQGLTERVKDRTGFICLNKGCYSFDGMLSFHSNGDMSSSLQETGSEHVQVTTIDRVVGDEKTAFIKMDIEGAELEALKGAEKVIKRDMPVLAVSAYHRQEDLITLIPYIYALHNEDQRYHLYLRHHGTVQTELVIYAVPGGMAGGT